MNSNCSRGDGDGSNDSILERSSHRLRVRKRKHTQRKNGLEYAERRLILRTDAEIPGETGTSSEGENESEAETEGERTDGSESRTATDETESRRDADAPGDS